MAVKLDMSKAYDRVGWKFIKEIMTLMGSPLIGLKRLWINGFKGENFQPSRGLRQGDPLSPFMFLVCGEGLSCLMRLAMNEGLLR
ncbi:reverse transcriptase [Gossypium australe]|uniref:Reverse transcriptase n=1 Tax=Gossypium australe TaxID=47621 RepID=A0A5B6WYV1_9ROSI|nr:reverse transcriptase [Gossypium australe]